MTTIFRPRTLVLFLGDLLVFTLALWLSLFFRTLEAPSPQLFQLHLLPFSLLFVVWVGVFFIAGLYEGRTVLLQRRALSTTLLIAKTFNLVLAALFFFFVPLFGIAPKTLLFIYLPIALVLELLWRAWIFPRLFAHRPEPVHVVGGGPALDEVRRVLAHAHRPPVELVPAGKAAALVGLPQLYEDIFGRVALQSVDEASLVEDLSSRAHPWYDRLKRGMDILIALPLFLVSLVAYPFIALAVKLEDRGPVFVSLPRVGKHGRTISIKKFRSMSGNDAGDYGAAGRSKLHVTRIGKILRVVRLDELPQLWSVVRGDLSLIGPRPETPALVAIYEKEVPYYNLRHLIAPGLSGWAILYQKNDPHHGTDIEATREKLSYDLYYLKHRSLVLDLTIALKTIKKLLTRSGV